MLRLQAVADVVASTDLADLPGADAAIILVVRADATFMDLAGPTKVIARHGIGVDNIDMLVATELRHSGHQHPEAPSESRRRRSMP